MGLSPNLSGCCDPKKENPPQVKMLLFDIDGTLLHTGGAGSRALEKAFEDLFGIEGAWKGIIPDGKTDPMIIQEMALGSLGRFLEGTEYEKVVCSYEKYFETEIRTAASFRLMPGIPGLFKKLLSLEGFLLGVATGNFEAPAWGKLERGGLRGCFSFGGFGSDSHDRTELTSRAVRRGELLAGRKFLASEVVVIGDTPFDVRAGKNLGFKTVAVATGHTAGPAWEEHAPDFVLSDFSDTGAAVDLLSRI